MIKDSRPEGFRENITKMHCTFQSGFVMLPLRWFTARLTKSWLHYTCVYKARCRWHVMFCCVYFHYVNKFVEQPRRPTDSFIIRVGTDSSTSAGCWFIKLRLTVVIWVLGFCETYCVRIVCVWRWWLRWPRRWRVTLRTSSKSYYATGLTWQHELAYLLSSTV